PPSWRGWAAWTAAEAAVVALILVMIFHSDRVPPQLRYAVYYTPAEAALVAVFARGRGALSAVIAGRVPVYLGEVSFAFYLLHAMAFAQVNRLLGPSWGAAERVAVMVGVTGLAAVVLHHAYEAPVRGWLLGLGRARRAGAEPAVAGRIGPAEPRRVAA